MMHKGLTFTKKKTRVPNVSLGNSGIIYGQKLVTMRSPQREVQSYRVDNERIMKT